MAEHPRLLPAPSRVRAADENPSGHRLGSELELDVELDDRLQEEQSNTALVIDALAQDEARLVGEDEEPPSVLGVLLLWLLVLLLIAFEAGTLVGAVSETLQTNLRSLPLESRGVQAAVLSSVGFLLTASIFLAHGSGGVLEHGWSRKSLGPLLCVLGLLVLTLALATTRLHFDNASVLEAWAAPAADSFGQVVVAVVGGLVLPLAVASLGIRAIASSRALRRHHRRARQLRRLRVRHRRLLQERRELRRGASATSPNPNDDPQE